MFLSCSVTWPRLNSLNLQALHWCIISSKLFAFSRLLILIVTQPFTWDWSIKSTEIEVELSTQFSRNRKGSNYSFYNFWTNSKLEESTLNEERERWQAGDSFDLKNADHYMLLRLSRIVLDKNESAFSERYIYCTRTRFTQLHITSNLSALQR